MDSGGIFFDITVFVEYQKRFLRNPSFNAVTMGYRVGYGLIGLTSRQPTAIQIKDSFGIVQGNQDFVSWLRRYSVGVELNSSRKHWRKLPILPIPTIMAISDTV